MGQCSIAAELKGKDLKVSSGNNLFRIANARRAQSDFSPVHQASTVTN